MTWLTRLGYIAIAVLLWIRFAPSSVERWHDRPIDTNSPKRLGYLTKLHTSGSPSATLQALDAIIVATSRTKVLAGRVEEGKITYVTRSLFLGAPDYTTVQIEMAGGVSQLTIYGRIRYGGYDYGVNRKRIKGWVQTLETLE